MSFTLQYYYGLGKFAGTERPLSDYRSRVTREHAWFGYGYRVGGSPDLSKWQYRKPGGEIDKSRGWMWKPVVGMVPCIEAAIASGLKIHLGANWQLQPAPPILRDSVIGPFRQHITAVEIADEPDNITPARLKWMLWGKPGLLPEKWWKGVAWAGFKRLLPEASCGIVYDKKRLSRLDPAFIGQLDWIGAEVYVDAPLQDDWKAIKADATATFKAAFRKVVVESKRRIILVAQAFTRSNFWKPTSYPNLIGLNEHLWDLVKPYAGNEIIGISWFNLNRIDGTRIVPGLADLHQEVFNEARSLKLI